MTTGASLRVATSPAKRTGPGYGRLSSGSSELLGEGVLVESSAIARDVKGVRLRFSGGRVVEASAESEQDFLLATLDTDEGARRLGELGIGCNPAITCYMRTTHFDEKMDGTVHLALGHGFADLGGRNESAVHWDMVKDLRNGGRIEVDGTTVQRDGVWVE